MNFFMKNRDKNGRKHFVRLTMYVKTVVNCYIEVLR